MNIRPATSALRCLALALTGLALAAPAAAQDSFGGAPPQQQQQQQQQQQPQPQPYAPPAAPAGTAPGTSFAPAAPANDALARQAQSERQDMGVAATTTLKSGGLHGPTPNQLPGGRLVTTAELAQLLRDPASGTLVFDVLGGPQRLPNALPVVPASQGGSFDDGVQREFGQYLQQVTQGRKDRPMVFYCQSVQCWMSYNAALRATRLGYSNVLWYRGGIEAWQQAGLPLASGGMPGG
jgi:rhodanese-related sulfurtransferase